VASTLRPSPGDGPEPERPVTTTLPSSSSNNNFRGVCPTGPTIRAGALHAGSLRRVIWIGHDPPCPAQVFSGHYVPVDTSRTIPARSNRLATCRTLIPLSWAERCAGQDDQVHPTVFRRQFSVAQGPIADRLVWADRCMPCRSTGTLVTRQCRLEPATGYGRMGRGHSCVRKASSHGRAGNGECNSQARWAPRPIGRARLMGRAVLDAPACAKFLAQEFMPRLGVPTSRSLMAVDWSRAESRAKGLVFGDPRSFDPTSLVVTPAGDLHTAWPSFLRVGQLELFARPPPAASHVPGAWNRTGRWDTRYLIERNYRQELIRAWSSAIRLVEAAPDCFAARLSLRRGGQLDCAWVIARAFNSAINCAAGGFHRR